MIQRSILSEMLSRIEKVAKEIVLGDPTDPATTMGPLISRAQYDKVVEYIKIGRRDAKLVFGGRHGPELVPSLPGGYWVEPTLFLTEDNRLPICQEEIFGPVAVVIPFDTDDEAVALANDSRYGLAAGVWTRNLARVHRMTRDLQAGTVWVNTFLDMRYELPFTGVKDSGYGEDAVLEFTYEKAVVIQT